MTEIVRIGLAIDSTQAATAATNLDKLPPAARRAESAFAKIAATATAALGDLTQETRNLASTNAHLANAIAGLTAKFDRQTVAADGAARATDKNARSTAYFERELDKLQRLVDRHQAALRAGASAADAHAKGTEKSGKAAQQAAAQVGLARHELINLGRQTQDVGTMLAMGASPLQVLASQGAQVFDIFSSTKSSMSDVRAQLLGFVTPTRVLALGVVAVAAGAAAAVISWKNFALALDDTARAAGTTTVEMAKLQAAASFKGISNDDFSAGIGRFSRSVYEARAGMGGLADILRANGVPAARDFDDAMEKAADLIMRARDDQQRLVLLQQMGLPATMEWVRLTRNGADGLRLAKEQAVAAGGSINDSMVLKAREFDEAWNRAWTNFKAYARDSVVSTTGLFSDLDDAITEFFRRNNPQMRPVIDKMLLGGMTPSQVVAGRFPRDGEFGTQKTTIDTEKLRNDITRMQQLIGLLGELATVEQRVQLARLQMQAAGLNGVHVTKEQARAIENLARVQAEQQRIQDRAAIGLHDAANAQAALNRELQSLVDRGLIDPSKPEQMATAYGVLARRLRETAESAQVAASSMPNLTRYALDAANMQKGLDQALTNGMRSIEDNLASVVMGTKSVAAAFKDMVNSIISDLIKLMIRQHITGPLAGLLGLTGAMGGGAGAGGGFSPFGLYHTGGVVGHDARPGKSVSPLIFVGAPRFHRGGIPGLGPDEVPIIAQRNEEIIRRDDPRHRFNGGGIGGGPPIVNVNMKVTNNAPGTEVQTKQQDDGTLEILINAVDAALAGRMSRGRGGLAKAAGARARNAHLRG